VPLNNKADRTILHLPYRIVIFEEKEIFVHNIKPTNMYVTFNHITINTYMSQSSCSFMIRGVFGTIANRFTKFTMNDYTCSKSPCLLSGLDI